MSGDQPIYRFSDSELKALASFLRQNAPLSDELYAFSCFVEKYIYGTLTIGEAEQLYTV